MTTIHDRKARPAPDEQAEPVAEYRYPGSPPFADTDIDRRLFRGRSDEIDHVLHSILSVDLLVVYAISGLGKTSLLTAGVLEPLRQRDYFPVIVRLNDPTMSPVALISAQIHDAGKTAPGIAISRHPSAADGLPATLWDLLSALEVWRGNTMQHLVLIFDQFEELFTLDWSDDHREGFIRQLGEVMRGHRTESAEGDADASLPPPAVKVTLIVREDSLGELEALAAHVPQILRHRFRLDGLSPDAAKAAICEPAGLVDERLITQGFAYSDGAAQAILDFLRKSEVNGRPALASSIDPSQLQIICQHVERTILPAKVAASGPDATVEILESDIGDEAGLEQILRDFYRNELGRFSSSKRALVRRLCEVGLINRQGRRLSLEEGQIAADYHLSATTLEELVDRRLLRAEPRVGSVYYELAHDTLTGPITAYRDESRLARRTRRRRWIVGAVALCLAAAAIVLALLLRDDSSDAADELEVGESLSDTLADGDTAVVSFEAPSDQPLVVEVVPDDSLDAVLEVATPDGAVEPIDRAGSGQPESEIVQATGGGLHEVSVSGFESSGDFRLSVQPVEVTELAVGDSASGTIDPSVARGVYRIDMPPGERAVVAVVPDEDLDPVLEVRGPGPQTADFGGEGGVEVSVVDGALAADSLVVVTGYSSTAGGYEVSVRPADVMTVAMDDAVTGAIDATRHAGVFQVDVPSGQPIVVEAAPGAGFDTTVRIENPDGYQQYSDADGTGGSEAVLIDGSVPGHALAVVTGGGSSTGEYTLHVRPAEAVALPLDSLASSSIGAGRPGDVFEFEVSDDQPLIVEVEPDVGLDPMLSVRRPDGGYQYAHLGVNGEDEVAVIDGTVAGNALVVVTGVGASTGTYDVSVSPVDAADVAVGDSRTGAIDQASAAGVFHFDVAAAAPLVVDVAPDDSLDAVLTVTEPGGVSRQVDDGRAGAGEEVVIGAATAGRYLVVVTGYPPTTGQYVLSSSLSEAVDVPVGGSSTGSIEEGHRSGVFQLDLPDGQRLVLDIVPESGFDPVVTVTGPGDLYRYADDGGDGTTEQLVLNNLSAGRYLAVVTGYRSAAGESSAGEYSVRLQPNASRETTTTVQTSSE